MKYPLKSRKPNTRKIAVEALQKEIAERVERAEVLSRELGKEKRRGKQKERRLKYNEIEAIRQEIKTKQERLRELTGQTDRTPSDDATFPPRGYRPPEEQKSNKWVVVWQGGAPGLGKRS